jgi:hypothetical protein
MNLKRLATLPSLVLLSLLLTACGTSNQAENAGGNTPAADGNTTAAAATGAAFRWENTEHDFGDIQSGETVTYKFKFTNTGTANLILEEVKPSCGCTTPEWTREPVPPGGTGFVTVSFDSNGKSGVQNKSVTVIANTEPRNVKLSFRANVLGGQNG